MTKIGAQLLAAGVALASGLSVEIVGNDMLALAIGLAWFVGMTNAFNLLDNMDALAAALAIVAALSFAVDAAVVSTGAAPVALALALAATCAAFLPFNLPWRRDRPLAFMGDSGSQTIGFALAALGLASSWSVAGATLATVLVPLFVLGVPIIDTGLVAISRLLEGRPIHRGGRDHTSHRLVYRGLSEGRAVLLLVAVAAALAATSLAYRALDNTALTLVGLFVTFAALVQFVSYLSAVDTGAADAAAARRTPFDLRRLVEVLVDFALVSAAFIAAYMLVVGGEGTEFEEYVFSLALPAVVASRFVAFLVFGIYKRVWRYAGARDAAAIGVAVAVSELGALAPALALDELAPFPCASSSSTPCSARSSSASHASASAPSTRRSPRCATGAAAGACSSSAPAAAAAASSASCASRPRTTSSASSTTTPRCAAAACRARACEPAWTGSPPCCTAPGRTSC